MVKTIKRNPRLHAPGIRRPVESIVLPADFLTLVVFLDVRIIIRDPDYE